MCFIAENVDDINGHSVFLTKILRRSFFFDVKVNVNVSIIFRILGKGLKLLTIFECFRRHLTSDFVDEINLI